MASVFIAGSRRFAQRMDEAARACKTAGIVVATAGAFDLSKKDTLASEHAALRRAFRRISLADALYVVADGGHVGKTVCLEIAYAFARGVPIISSERIEDLSVRGLVDSVLAPAALARRLSRRKRIPRESER